jgi:hypothetical protein
MRIIITQGFLKGNLISHKHTAILKDTWTMAQDTQVKARGVRQQHIAL